MRKSLFILLLGVATAAGAQQADKDAETRIRAERSAGGVGKITPEEKSGANLGAGPHKERKPADAARREPRKEASKDQDQDQAGAGATR
jgi:hypothetical protein